MPQFSEVPDGNNALQDDPSPLQAATDPSTGPGYVSPHAENHERYLNATSEMDRLQKQYSDLSGQNADAYAAQKKALQDATERLNAMNFGPSAQEQHYRNLAAFTDGSHGGYGFNPAEVNQTKADILKEQREAEMQKQQLLSNYAMQIPQATIAANKETMNQNLGQQRVLGSQINNSANSQFKRNGNDPWYVARDNEGNPFIPKQNLDALNQVELSHLYGRFTLVPNADGSKRIVPGASIAAPQNGSAQPQTGNAPQIPGPSAPGTGAPRSAAPQTGLSPQFLSGLFQPSNVLSPRYGALTQDTKPVYVQTAQQAFDPQEFQNYKFTPDWLTNNKDAMKKDLEQKNKEMSSTLSGANNTISNYGRALQAIDGLQNDPKLMTGPFGEKKAALENFLRGAVGDDLTATILNDPQLKALEAKQDSDKYFRQAATAGLQAVYHGRITNQELSTQLASLPSSNLMPAVARMLSKAQTDIAQDNVNKAKLWPVYVQKGGNPSMYDAWYETHFSPFSTDSVLTKNLQAAKSGAQQAPQNPLVQYYTALAQWRANGQKGPAPQKPQ